MLHGFTLDEPTYSPAQFATLYSVHVRPVSYATVLKWIAQGANSGGTEGMTASRELRSGYFRIPQTEARRVLLAAGATEKENAENGTTPV